jgi:predicted kinase
MAMELVILMGLQASGKSTFRRERFDPTHAVVSKDLLRNNRRPQRRQMELIEEALGAGSSVIVDNTNPRREDRAPLIAAGRRFDARVIGYFFSSAVADSSRRNAGRTGKERVPEVALHVTAKLLERPARDEGFDELYIVRISDETRFDVQPLTGSAP